MFVVDALIGNNDRNNGNWGIVRRIDESKELAPIYDNGNSINNKSSDRQLTKILANKGAFLDSAYRGRTCVYMEWEKAINPHEYILSMKNDGCNSAVLRITPNIDMNAIGQIINGIPQLSNVK